VSLELFEGAQELSMMQQSVKKESHRLITLLYENQERISLLEQQLSKAKSVIEFLGGRGGHGGNGGGGNSSTVQNSEGSTNKNTQRYWTPAEHERFLEALNRYGRKDVKAIADHVETRNATQVRTHAQKYFIRIKREDPELFAKFFDEDEAASVKDEPARDDESRSKRQRVG